MKLLKQLLPALLTYIGIVMFFVFSVAYIKAGTKFGVRHSDKVEQTVNADGTYTAGSPELYHVDISRALAWELSGSYTKAFKTGAVIVLVLLFVVFISRALDWIEFPGNSFGWTVWVLMATAAGLLIAAYSSAFVSNFVEVSPQVYDRFKDNLAELFRNKALIR